LQTFIIFNKSHPVDFNFKETYASYSNVELLKIIRSKEKYQTSAIEAAHAILDDRNITDDDLAEVDAYYREIASKEHYNKFLKSSVNDAVFEYINPESSTATKINPQRWLLVASLFLLYKLIDASISAYKVVNYTISENIKIDEYTIVYCLSPIAIGLTLYLLLKRKKWGWALLFAYALYSSVSDLAFAYWFFKFQDIHHQSTVGFLFNIFIECSLTVFLWKKEITSYFKISRRTKMQAAFLIIIATLFIIAINYYQ